MSKHKKFDIEKISVAEMFIVNAAIDNKSELLTLEKEAYSFHFEYSFEPAVNSVEKKVRVVFICDISTFTKGNVEININGKFEKLIVMTTNFKIFSIFSLYLTINLKSSNHAKIIFLIINPHYHRRLCQTKTPQNC